MAMFTKATRDKLKLRMALCGPAGSGKSWTGLSFAHALAGKDGKIAAIDSERNSLKKYVGETHRDTTWQFDHCNLDSFAPATYTAVIEEAGRLGYDVLLIDGISQAWDGVDGALDQVDRKGGNSFTAWKDVTPQHRRLVDAILAFPGHVIVTMRTKVEYVLEENSKGKMVPRKVGMKPIQRDGLDYEFDVVCDVDLDHMLTVGKTRCSAIDGKQAPKPGPEFMAPIMAWLDEGTQPKEDAGPSFQQAQATPNVLREAAAEPTSAVPDTRQTASVHGRCTEAVAQEIVAVAKAISMREDQLKAAVQKRGAQSIRDLTIDNADDLLAALKHIQMNQAATKVF